MIRVLAIVPLVIISSPFALIRTSVIYDAQELFLPIQPSSLSYLETFQPSDAFVMKSKPARRRERRKARKRVKEMMDADTRQSGEVIQ